MTTPPRLEAPFPSAEPVVLRLAVAACRLRAAAGEGPLLVSGTYDEPSGAIPPTVAVDGGKVTVSQRYELARTFDLLSGGTPAFDLALGGARPFALELDSGASDVTLDLGGLPLTRLVIRQAAGRLRLDFSRPCPAGLGQLRVEAGAASIELRNLCNAGFAELVVAGGAARCTAHFGGALARDARARLDAGVAAVRVAVPGATPARIEASSVVGALQIGDGLTKRAGAFWTEAAVAGKTPVLDVHAETAVGLLELVVEG
ncbi:MAG: hypothetical protein U0229_21110 [Anaeromyxobacter sp.]